MRRSRSFLFFMILLAVVACSQLVGARSSGASAPSFATPVDLTDGDVQQSSVAWGDYDADGDLDILLTGFDGSNYVSKIYENDSGSFVEDTVAEAGLAGVDDSSATWGDYDADGDLDILLTGYSGSEAVDVSRIYQNDGSGQFTSVANLIGVERGSAAWGDYDLDGDLDILLTGASGSNYIGTIYRNDAGSFAEDTAAGADLPDVADSSAAWGDYDADGDLDILLTGFDGSNYVSEIYQNDGAGSFFAASVGLTAVSNGSAAWGDYDSDGKLDILLTGDNGSGPISWVYRQISATTFSLVASLNGVYESSVAWGDQDSDGDLDILLTGNAGTDPSPVRVSEVYEIDGGAFNEYGAGLTPVRDGSAAWGDYDLDGDLDILLTGKDSATRVGQIYQNQSTEDNTAPSAPANPSAIPSGSDVTLSWDAASDGTETPSAALTYNLRVGTTPGGSDVVSPMADSSGERLLPQMGNAGERTSHTLKLAPGTYYWSVQAIDNSFAGSAFSSEGIFTVGFQDLEAGLTGVDSGSVAWGDYDNDGDLDALLSGRNQLGQADTSIFQNDGAGGFSDITAGLTPVSMSSVAWGDYDSDGDLDILLSGYDGPDPVSEIYRNNGDGTFTDVNAGVTGVYNGSVAWGDYDSDGDLDIALSGNTQTGSTNAVSLIYRNDNGVFQDIGASLIGVVESSLAWGDYDSDGNLDLLVTGCSTYTITCDARVSNIYRNDGAGHFNDIAAGLTPVSMSSVAWGDYDSDGELDLVLSGIAGGSRAAKIYHASGGTFTDIGADLTPVSGCSVTWGDYDSDGDLDLLTAGAETGFAQISKIYRNDGSDDFIDVGAGLIGVENSSGAWGDYDSDGDLDILLAGWNDSLAIPTSTIYENFFDIANTPPSAPGNLTSSISGDDGFVLSWDASSDGQTIDARGLTYNLRVGTTPGGSDVVSPMARTNGTRLLPQMGNAGQATSYTLKNLPADTYYWSVQAIDNNFAGSAFATNGSFTVPGSFAFSSASYPVGEEDGSIEITIRRLGSTAAPGSVNFSTANGTATAGSDYTSVSQPISFAVGETSKTIDVPLLDDPIYEGDETISLALTSPSSGESLGNPNNATITIIDDDPAPELALSAATYTVAEATPSVTVAITRSVNLSGPVSVRFATANGTASAGSDYTAVDEIVTFDTGESRKPITIQIREDEAYEGSEALSLSLSSPSGAILGNPPTATLTITDNDRATISFSRSSYSVSETGADAQITINRSGAMASAFAVRIATANGTASAGSDYTSLNEFVVFAARQSATTISISIRDDSLVEGNETILLALSNLSAGADLGNPGTATLTITDNDVAQTKGRIASAKLSKKVFTRAQARKVKLTVKFAPRSKLFRCVVSLKKGKKWVTVKSVKKTSFYKSRYTNTVKRLFAGKKLKKGAYRLRLSADKNSRTLSFRIR